jgi:NADH-quinone oxidoreductase subunit J
MERIIFYILALAIVVFSVMTVTSRNILRAAIYLLFVLMATAAIYFMLNYNFLAAVQLTVYSGGVVVLIVFAVLLTARMDHKLEKAGTGKAIISALLVFSGLSVVLWTIFGYNFMPNGLAEGAYDVKAIGTSLLSYGDYGYVLPFEVISVLLLASMIGAIMIAKRYTK